MTTRLSPAARRRAAFDGFRHLARTASVRGTPASQEQCRALATHAASMKASQVEQVMRWCACLTRWAGGGLGARLTNSTAALALDRLDKGQLPPFDMSWRNDAHAAHTDLLDRLCN